MALRKRVPCGLCVERLPFKRAITKLVSRRQLPLIGIDPLASLLHRSRHFHGGFRVNGADKRLEIVKSSAVSTRGVEPLYEFLDTALLIAAQFVHAFSGDCPQLVSQAGIVVFPSQATLFRRRSYSYRRASEGSTARAFRIGMNVATSAISKSGGKIRRKATGSVGDTL